MSDPRDASGSGAETTPEPPSTGPGGRAEEADRSSGESWFDRLRAAVGLRSSSVRRELEEALEEEGPGDGFSPQERALLNNILQLRETRVSDIMIPRGDVYAVEIDAPLSALMAEFHESGHSRMPIYRESLDDPVGMVHIKDLMSYLARMVGAAGDGTHAGSPDAHAVPLDLGRTVAEAGLVRNVLFVPPSMPVATLLSMMQSARMQMALVIDEFGGTDGLVSIEDAVETIVGDIEDEHDEETPDIVAGADGFFVVDGATSIDEVAESIGGDLGAARDEDEVETIGGLVFNLLGRIPTAGEVVSVPGGFEIVVLDSDQRRVRRMKIRRLDSSRVESGDGPVAESLSRAASGA